MPGANQVFVFFFERLSPTDRQQSPPVRPRIESMAQPPPDWVEVPGDRVSYLTAYSGEPPRVVEEFPATRQPAGVLESVRQDNRRYLLLLSPPGQDSRVNGAPAPRVAALQSGDQVRLDGDYILHLSIYERPYVGVPLEVHIDVECPLCRLRIAAGTTGVYQCPDCDAVLHCEGAEKAAEERLECARLTAECPQCTHPIRFEPGFVYVPQI